MTSLRLFHMASEVVWDTQGVFFNLGIGMMLKPCKQWDILPTSTG